MAYTGNSNLVRKEGTIVVYTPHYLVLLRYAYGSSYFISSEFLTRQGS